MEEKEKDFLDEIEEALIVGGESIQPDKLDELEEATCFSIKYFNFYKTTKPLCFLGASLKKLIIHDYLYSSFPSYKKELLVELTKELNRLVDDQVLKMKSKEIINNKEVNYMLNYISAIYHFNGYIITKKFFIKYFLGNDQVIIAQNKKRPYEEAYIRGYKLSERDQELVSKVEGYLGMTFTNKFIIKEAYTLRSFIDNKISPEISEYDKHFEYQFDQEQLSYLGDGLIEFVLSEFIFQNYQDYSRREMEETLKHLKMYMISHVLQTIHYTDVMNVSFSKENIANYTALIAAIYLDRGISELKRFIQDNISVKTNEPPSYTHLKVFAEKNKVYLENDKPYKIDGIYITRFYQDGCDVGVGEGLTERESILDASAKSFEYLQLDKISILTVENRKVLTTTKTLERKNKMKDIDRTKFKCLTIKKDEKKEGELLQKIKKIQEWTESNRKQAFSTTPEKKRGYQEEIKTWKQTSKNIKKI